MRERRAACRAREPERLIEAEWGAPREEVFPVDIVVEATDRQGLLRDISEVLSREKINVTAVNTQTRQHQARMAFTLEVENLAQLKRALQMAQDIPGVFGATPVIHTCAHIRSVIHKRSGAPYPVSSR